MTMRMDNCQNMNAILSVRVEDTVWKAPKQRAAKLRTHLDPDIRVTAQQRVDGVQRFEKLQAESGFLPFVPRHSFDKLGGGTIGENNRALGARFLLQRRHGRLDRLPLVLF